tara:strand:+ start:1816 stop:2481 length:666 start_codon:yes stop_codon:yes gene_type:complete
VNKQLILKASELALAAYNEDIKGAMKIENARTSTTAFILEEDNIQYIIFRGTQQVRDWIFNMTAIPWRYRGRWVHGGFMTAHRSVWKRIESQLDASKEVVMIGHSLGGALAELSAHVCRAWPKVKLITFGKPNVFLRPSKAKMKQLKTQISFVCGSDVVSRIPAIGYSPDAGQTLVYFDNDDNTWVNPDKNYVRQNRGISDAVSDHDMSGYRNLVLEFCAK